MKVVLNCCTRPAKFMSSQGVTLFRGEKPEVATQAQVQAPAPQQPAKDTVELSTKQPEVKAEVKPEQK